MKKQYIFGALALAAVVRGYLWYKSKSNKPQPPIPAKAIKQIDEPELDPSCVLGKCGRAFTGIKDRQPCC